jgi:hypothetical protein
VLLVYTKNSKVADVAAYVGGKLEHYEFVEELRRFIEDQRINGNTFLNLTDDKLKICGLKALGDRENLLMLVEICQKADSDSEKLRPVALLSEPRLKRQREINAILDRKPKKQRNGSTPFSSAAEDLELLDYIEKNLKSYKQTIRKH